MISMGMKLSYKKYKIKLLRLMRKKNFHGQLSIILRRKRLQWMKKCKNKLKISEKNTKLKKLLLLTKSRMLLLVKNLKKVSMPTINWLSQSISTKLNQRSWKTIGEKSSIHVDLSATKKILNFWRNWLSSDVN